MSLSCNPLKVSQKIALGTQDIVRLILYKKIFLTTMFLIKIFAGLLNVLFNKAQIL